MITGMDRLVAALNGTPSDRIPIFCNLLDQGAQAIGVALPEYYTRGELVAEAQLKMRERYGHDNVWSLFYVGKEAELLGCKKVLFAEDGPPNVADWVIKSPADIRQLKVPSDLAGHPAFEQGLRCLEILRKEIGGRYPVCAYLTATMALPALLMGMEKWMELLFMGPERDRNELLNKCHEFFVKEVEVFKAHGADVLLYSNPFGSTDIVPMKFFLETALPWIERDIADTGKAGWVYYCGMASMNSVIDTIITRTGIGAFYLSPMDNLSAGKATIDGRGLTCGVINDIKLIDMTVDEVRQEVQALIASGKRGGKFLFGTGVMPLCIPEENITTMMETAKESGALR
jgi:uroporphyrinogen-III decarboxylase